MSQGAVYKACLAMNFPTSVNIKRFMEFKSGTNADVSSLPENYKRFVFNDLDGLVQ